MYATHRLNLIHIPIKFHEHIPNSYRVIGCGVQDYSEKCKETKEHNLETKKVGIIILMRDTLSLPNTHSYKIAWRYHEQWVSYTVYKNVITQNKHKTQSNGHSCKIKEAKAAVIIRYTLSWPDMYTYKISWRYPKGLLSYGAYKNIEKKCKKIKRGNTQKLINKEQSFLYATHFLDQIHIPIKCHEDISNGYRVMGCTRREITQNKHKNKQNAITLKPENRTQPWLYATRRPDLNIDEDI